MRNGRLGRSGVSTGTGEPWSGIGPFLPFIFIPGLSPDIRISWADSTFAEAKIPAPARTFCKKPRLLFMLFSFQGRMTEFQLRCAIIAFGDTSGTQQSPHNFVLFSAAIRNFI